MKNKFFMVSYGDMGGGYSAPDKYEAMYRFAVDFKLAMTSVVKRGSVIEIEPIGQKIGFSRARGKAVRHGNKAKQL